VSPALPALAITVVLGTIAHAEPAPDPAVAAAGEANLESTARHEGLDLTLALGGGLTLGIGIADSVGRGGAGSLRIGHAATPRSVLTLELAGVALFHAVKTTTGETTTRTNNDSNLLIGAQYFVHPALWLRVAVGFGIYRAEAVGPSADDVRLMGPSGAVGAGFDLVRWRRAAIGLEMISIGMINREGLLSSNGFMLDVSVD
jgi:hypothetical protein